MILCCAILPNQRTLIFVMNLMHLPPKALVGVQMLGPLLLSLGIVKIRVLSVSKGLVLMPLHPWLRLLGLLLHLLIFRPHLLLQGGTGYGIFVVREVGECCSLVLLLFYPFAL